jgi:hypothetical protein
MKKLLLIAALFSVLTLLSSNALALTLSLEPDLQSTIPGGGAALALNIAGLDAGGPISLGAFDLGISFNDSILNFEYVFYSQNLGSPDPLDFETFIFTDDLSPGYVRLQEVSLLWPPELDILQSEQFNLAFLTFRGEAIGFSDLELKNVVLSDAFGFQIPNPSLDNASVNVVPEPATVILLCLGIFGCVLFRFKKFFK